MRLRIAMLRSRSPRAYREITARTTLLRYLHHVARETFIVGEKAGIDSP